jgi:hypothetical protein
MDDYYRWLIDLLHDDYLGDFYQKLLMQLFDTEFIWFVEYDENRAADGIELREEYRRETGFESGCHDKCTVLEMLVALCRDCNDELMYDPELGDRTGYWFWVMMENLGLDIYDDYHYDSDAVDTILERFLTRDYDENGFGGLFPCVNNVCDFRDKDLWWQLNAFLEENFPL